jgi:colanic acid/amylovoran biosynthesis glycosyltransferase
MVVDQFPELSETFIAAEARALQELGHSVRVEARTHPSTPNPAAASDLSVSVAADDKLLRKLLDVCWLVGRHPLRSARDLIERRRWRREEPVRSLRSLAPTARRIVRANERHLHVHFAAGAALDALRLGRLLRLPYSVMAHAYDIFREPTNLREKLAAASFAATASDFTVSHLRELAGEPHAARIHKLVLGIDPNRFRRRTPYPGGRVVAAVGRLVEKKGFAHLIDAAALLERSLPLERLVVLGDGPLADSLRSQAEALGVGGRVEWLGPRPPDEVHALLERADLLAMPCVVARDGDRDSSPVVVKEALAMETPVVASDGFGMEEVVRPAWGRLVPAGGSAAVAAAIEELLALPPERRDEMGRAGRAWVLRGWNLYREAEKLAALIEGAGERGRPTGDGAGRAPGS